MNEKIERLLALDWAEEVTPAMNYKLNDQVWDELAPCGNREFLKRYLELDSTFDVK